MKAAVYYSLDDIRVEDLPKPRIGHDEILVEMKACGICGSDLMEWYLKSRAPLVLGHEPTGVIAEIGNEVKDFKVGDKVFVHHHVACLKCHYCIHGNYTMCEQFGKTCIVPGGFAEYFKVPAPNLKIDTLKIPDTLSFEEATLIEPVACCIRAVRKYNVQPSDVVAIVGAGPSGIVNTMLLRNSGASKIIVSDLVDYRLKVAEKVGADLTINPKNEDFVEKLKIVTDGRGADLVVVTAPSVEAFSQGMQACRRGGTLLLFAPTSPEVQACVSPHRLFFSEITILPSYSTSHVETRMALELIKTGRIKAKELVTHRFPLAKIQDAFRTVIGNRECLKMVVTSE
jgi:L-iditol 2-dehydrogenase